VKTGGGGEALKARRCSRKQSKIGTEFARKMQKKFQISTNKNFKKEEGGGKKKNDHTEEGSETMKEKNG